MDFVPLPKLRLVGFTTSTKMEVSLKVSFLLSFFLLSSAIGQFNTESVEEPEERTRQQTNKQNKYIKEILKSELETHFSNLWQILTKKNSETLSKLERDHEMLSANLARQINENMGHLYWNLSRSFNKRQTNSDLKMEKSLLNLTETFTRMLSSTELKMERSLQNQSESFGEQMLRSESKLTGDFRSLNDTLWRNHQQLTRSLSVTTSPTSIPNAKYPLATYANRIGHTQVEEVNEKQGTIQFARGSTCLLRRKVWVFRPNGTSIALMSFLLEENKLTENASLSLWASSYNDGRQHVWNGSQSDWRKERSTQGYVILITLLISPFAEEQPSFKLKFKTHDAHSDNQTRLSELVVTDDHVVLSFPPNNTDSLTQDSSFIAIIAPPTPFLLKLTYLDVPGSPPDSCNNWFFVYFLEDTPSGLHYKTLPSTTLRRCGSVGFVSEPLGNSTIAIIQFWNYGGNTGKGIRLEVN